MPQPVKVKGVMSSNKYVIVKGLYQVCEIEVLKRTT